MQVTFWGVRGSIPTPGPTTTRYGGNSSCVEVRLPSGLPLVLDAGTGARALGHALARGAGRDVHVLFTHLHADHVFGFPFFMPLYSPGWTIRVGVPAENDRHARDRLGRWLDGVFHPTRLREVPARLDFHAVQPEQPFTVDGATVTPFRLHHPGGSLGYRVDAETGSMAYVTDTAPFTRPFAGLQADEPPVAEEARVVEVLRGCDLVVFDTMFERDEYLEKMTWGHAYPEYAVRLCEAAGVGRLALFHHLPDATDDDLDRRQARFADRVGPTVVTAREGETITLG